MDYELPSEFDLIVVGTGMIESIIAAAASRIGKRVLHIDSNNYYGGLWASFNLDTISKIDGNIRANLEIEVNTTELIKTSETLYAVGNDLFNISIQSQSWYIPESSKKKDDLEELNANSDLIEKVDQENDEKSEEPLTRETLLKSSRKFNIDLAPKLHFARGDFVELLISSNIARYSEFRSVSRVLTWLNGALEVVPCSRSDVFSSTKVSVIEKRMLMKLLTSCVDGDENEFNGYENKAFRAYLKDKKLTDNLVHYVLYAIGMSTDTTPCLQGVENTKRFLGSLGRFGKTPLLYSMYGSGEIAQAFCRLSAVFGGIYALSQPLNGFIFDDENNFKSLLCGCQRLSASQIVMSAEYLPKHFIKFKITEYISRGIFITNKSILKGEKEHLTLLLFPSSDGKQLCTVLEVGSLTGTCLKDYYIVHLYTKQCVNPEEDLKEYVNKLFYTKERKPNSSSADDNVPEILWSFYYSVPNIFDGNLRDEMPNNVFVCPGPELDLDYDPAITKAKEVFFALYPDEEFLPRAPDPEDIIIEGEDNNNIIGEGDNVDQLENANVQNVNTGVINEKNINPDIGDSE